MTVLVNDVHSRLNATRVAGIAAPETTDGLAMIVKRAARTGTTLSIAGGRHSMGGQQFGAGTLLVDTTRMSRVLAFDRTTGIVEVEAGIQWPELMAYLERSQAGEPDAWGIVQKQTGADRFTLGGSLSSNVHGRGLRLRPLVGDIDSFVLVDPDGEPRVCSREENRNLFGLVIGGYGLFGAVASLRLRLDRRQKVERVVELAESRDVIAILERRIAEGFGYGDFQFATDVDSPDGLRRGVLSCYRPVRDGVPIRDGQRELGEADWRELLRLAHTDRSRAFAAYARHYLETSGQVYWSDVAQTGVYLDGYHEALDRTLGGRRGSEMITELYVPRPRLADLLEAMRDDFRRHRVPLVYGTVRLIERDDETFLAWARERWACVVVNLHCDHDGAGIAASAAHFRRLIDLAIARSGSFYLTYHRWATAAQIEAAYPGFPSFLSRKLDIDPEERFQSDWYRQVRQAWPRRRFESMEMNCRRVPS